MLNPVKCDMLDFPTGLIVILVFFLSSCNSSFNEDDTRLFYEDFQAESINSRTILVPSHRPSMDYYPCNDCHSYMEVNTSRRELVDMHDDIVFNHDSENRWCFSCHDANNRDSLRLASGQLLSFDRSYELCGQCHGPKLRDWKLGIHGKRTGEWNGQKEYRLCVNCHDPHSPVFPLLKPMTPPRIPEEIRIDSIK